MWRSVLSVVVGYLTIAILTMVFFAVLQVVSPATFPPDGGMPPAGIVATIILLAFVFAAAGGVVTRLIARGNTKPVLALCGVIAILGLVSMALDQANQPIWYHVTLILVGVIGAIIGGRACPGEAPKTLPL